MQPLWDEMNRQEAELAAGVVCHWPHVSQGQYRPDLRSSSQIEYEYMPGDVKLGGIITQEKHDKPAATTLAGHQCHTALRGCPWSSECKGSTMKVADRPFLIAKTAAQSKAQTKASKKTSRKAAPPTSERVAEHANEDEGAGGECQSTSTGRTNVNWWHFTREKLMELSTMQPNVQTAAISASTVEKQSTKAAKKAYKTENGWRERTHVWDR
jgi:hypothetical protein